MIKPLQSKSHTSQFPKVGNLAKLLEEDFLHCFFMPQLFPIILEHGEMWRMYNLASKAAKKFLIWIPGLLKQVPPTVNWCFHLHVSPHCLHAQEK